MPTITVTGASRTFCVLPGLTQASRRALPSSLRTNWKRAGEQLAEVGPHLSRSYRSRSVASGTGVGR